jgi:hypothetical protein
MANRRLAICNVYNIVSSEPQNVKYKNSKLRTTSYKPQKLFRPRERRTANYEP